MTKISSIRRELFYHAVPFAEIQGICANLLSENKQAYPFENVLLGTNRYPVVTRTFFVFSNKMTFLKKMGSIFCTKIFALKFLH